MFNQVCFPDKMLPLEAKIFKEEIMTEIIKIPNYKPDMLEIIKSTVLPEVISYRIIKTEKGQSLEGQKLSGLKLLVKLKFKEKITYVANNCNYPIQTFYLESIKTMSVVLPEVINNHRSVILLKRGELIINPYAECVDVRKLDCRCAQICIMIFLNLEIQPINSYKEIKINKEHTSFEDIESFNHIVIDKKIIIPCFNPPINEIETLVVEAEIVHSYVINTPKNVNNEGQDLSGYKLIVHGNLKCVIEYIANLRDQSIHSVYYDIPFSTYIIVDDNDEKEKISVKIENAESFIVEEREIIISIALLLKINNIIGGI